MWEKKPEKVMLGQTNAFLNSKMLSVFCKNHSIDFYISFLNDKILEDFDRGLISDTGFGIIGHGIFYKNYMQLVSLKIV